MTISNDSVVVAVKSQVSCQLDAETVVLHFDKGFTSVSMKWGR